MNFHRSPLLFVWLLLAVPLGGQSSLFDALAARGDTLVLELDTDWRQLMSRKKDKAYQPLMLRLGGVADTTLALPGRIRTRGNVRLEVCGNPSLKIKLNKQALAAAGFAGELNDLKIVQQCMNNELGRSYLRREASLYDLHQIFSDYHHRVVPVRLVPRGREEDSYEAFLVESEEQLSARYAAPVMKSKRASTRGMQRAAYVNMCLFNYLILNTDWQVFNLHNLEVLGGGDDNRLIPIPYDFDYAGLVGTSYAVPDPKRNISSVQEPLWLGRGVTPAELHSGAELFLSLREVAEAYIEQHPGLSAQVKKRWLRRFKEFYAVIGSEKGRKRLLRNAR